MSYGIVVNDKGPEMPITIGDEGFVLDIADVCTLEYRDPTGTLHQRTLSITSAPLGTLLCTWADGDLPVPGAYRGLVRVDRSGDSTFPRHFPNGGDKIIWFISPGV